jgi:uncharacterized damage-inducible protein DinB
MPEEFEGQDLRDAVFWGVDLSGATFRDVNLTGATISHARLMHVDIDAFVEHVTINGVDVTDYVNEHDPWYPLRNALRPSDPDSMRAVWPQLQDAWSSTIEDARPLGEAKLRERVGGEWSLVETLRHLLFATDKWFTVPILGGQLHPSGMPNSGSVDFGWPGLDRAADPSLDEVLAARDARTANVGDYLQRVTPADLTRVVEVLENGEAPVSECLFTVLEEEFQHLRYATRDLALLRQAPPAD